MFNTTYILMGLTILISIMGFNNPQLIDKFSFKPSEIKQNRAYYRIFTHIFFHADSMHLLFNMMSFFFIGKYTEYVLVYHFGFQIGILHYLILYFGGATVGTLYSFYKNKDNKYYQSIGASGAVSSVIFGFILWEPNVEFLFFFAIPMKAFVFGFMYLAIEYFSMKRAKGRIAHDVHIFSALFGVVYVLSINFEKGKEFIDLLTNFNG